MSDMELKALQTRLKETTEKLDRFAANGMKVDGDRVEIKSVDAGAARSLMKEANDLRTLIEVKKFGADFQTWAGQADPSAAVRMAALKDPTAGRTIGELFTESNEFKSFAKSGQRTMDLPWETEIFDISAKAGMSGMQFKDQISTAGSHPVNIGVGTVVQFDPMVPRAQRTARVRDLFPVARTSANVIDFFRVTGFTDNGGKGNPAMVPEYESGNFGLKPKSPLSFTSDDAKVRIIAHWEAVHRNVVEDVPQLQSTINNELLYGLALKEDDQILNGDGSGENLRGVLNTPGIQNYLPSAVEWKADSLRRAITLAVLAYYPPTGIVLHPNDWEDIELQRGTTNDHYAITTNISIGTTPTVWRLPVVESPAMTEAKFLLGAFGTAAQLYDRQSANIRIAEQHSDFFVRNAIAVLCEERLALAVKRPEAFVLGEYKLS